MGIAADSLFNVLMSWVRALVNALWALFSADRTTALEFLGKNWMTIAVTIIICGLVIDWIVWLIRWQPYYIWARKLRRAFRLDEPDEETPKEKAKAHAAVMPEKRYARPERTAPVEETPLYLHGFDEGEEPDWDGDVEEVPEEAFMPYPGMRYDGACAYENQYTRPHSTLNPEEEDAEESTRRLSAVDAHQLQMQEEARIRAETEKAERERLEQEARAEQERLAREAFEAEQARLAYEAEQTRLAQEEYERQLEEYERQKAQYEYDLAEYERQKAEYEAQLAAQQAHEVQQQEQQTTTSASRRRRMPSKPQEETQVIPAQKPIHPAKSEKRPVKPNPNPAKPKAKPAAKPHAKNHEPPAAKSSGLLGRVAKMIEPEEEEIISRKTLPPRVDMNDAFRTAKLPVITPPEAGRRKK